MQLTARQIRPLLAVAAGLAAVTPAFADEAISTPPAGTAPDVGASAPLRTLTTRFAYTATVPAQSTETKTLNVWLPVPSDSPWQKVTDLTVDAPVPYKITREPKFGNRMVALHDTSPAAPLNVTVRFTVARREVRVLDTSDGIIPKVREEGFPTSKAALQPDKRVPSGGRFQTIALQVTQGQSGTLDKERVLFDNVVANMHYDYKKVSPEYAQGDSTFVCDYKSGNCSDLHSYLISLLRSVGVPSFLEFGFPLTGIPLNGPLPADGSIPGYHCWTWFDDVKRGWVPLDAADGRRWQDFGHPEVTHYLFGDLVLERSAVAMSRGRDLTLSPPQQGPALNYFIYPYAEADGKPVDATWKLTYHVVSQRP